MLKNEIDILLLGGGCTGLSIAYYLSFLPNNLNILIVDNKTLYNNDKTWCGWRIKTHAFIKCCQTFWFSFYLKKSNPYYSIIYSSFPYENIRSIFFYEKILNRIQNIYNINFENNKFINLTEYKTYVSVKFSSGKYKTARFVIDATPKKIKKLFSPWKWQNFFGIEIFYNDNFNFVLKPYFMNFYINKYLKFNNVNFLYILPKTNNIFLFEWTIFSSKEIFFINNLLIFYINLHIGKSNYQILRKETGHIPMAYITNKTNINKLAKLYGCYIRTSNGFSFHEIQKWAITCAYTSSLNKQIIIPKISYLFIFLDYIFMKTIDLYPNVSLFLYTNLFFYTHSISLLSFFTNSYKILDLLNILFFIKPKLFIFYTIFSLLF